MVSPISAARSFRPPGPRGTASGRGQTSCRGLRVEPRFGSRGPARRGTRGTGFLYEGRRLRGRAGLESGQEPLRGAWLTAGGWHIWRQLVGCTWGPRPARTPTGPPMPGRERAGSAGSAQAGASAAQSPLPRVRIAPPPPPALRLRPRGVRDPRLAQPVRGDAHGGARSPRALESPPDRRAPLLFCVRDLLKVLQRKPKDRAWHFPQEQPVENNSLSFRECAVCRPGRPRP